MLLKFNKPIEQQGTNWVDLLSFKDETFDSIDLNRIREFYPNARTILNYQGQYLKNDLNILCSTFFDRCLDSYQVNINDITILKLPQTMQNCKLIPGTNIDFAFSQGNDNTVDKPIKASTSAYAEYTDGGGSTVKISLDSPSALTDFFRNWIGLKIYPSMEFRAQLNLLDDKLDRLVRYVLRDK